MEAGQISNQTLKVHALLDGVVNKCRVAQAMTRDKFVDVESLTNTNTVGQNIGQQFQGSRQSHDPDSNVTRQRMTVLFAPYLILYAQNFGTSVQSVKHRKQCTCSLKVACLITLVWL
jgi:hypothetical protein